MTTPATPALDFAAAARWPLVAAAHLLGVGLLLAVLVALPAAPSDLDRHQLPKEMVVHSVVWLAVLFSRPFPSQGSTRAVRLAIVGLVTISALSAIMALNPWIAARATALTATTGMAFLTARHLAARGFATILTGWAVAAATAGAATGLAQAWGFEHPFFARTRAPGGTFGNRNFLGHLAAIALPLTLATLVVTLRTWIAVVSAVSAGVLTGALILTRSRAAWLAVLIALMVMIVAAMVAHRRAAVPMRPGRLALLLLTLATGIVTAFVVPNGLDWRSDSPYVETLGGLTNYREGSGRGRMVQYGRTLELAMQYPLLGVGPGNWPLRYGEVAPPNDPSWALNDPVPINPWPSSDLMAVMSERGFVAVVTVILLVIAMGWRAIRALRRGGARGLGGAGLLATMTALLVAGMFDAVMLLPIPSLFAAIALAVMLERSDGAPEVALPPTAPSHRWALALLILGLFAIRSVMQTAAYAIAGDGSIRSRLVWAARIDPTSYPIRIALARRGPCREARVHAAAALRLAPNWPAAKGAARRCPDR